MKQYTDIADINMGAMVEFALNDGKSRITGEQVSIHTGIRETSRPLTISLLP